MSAFKRLLVEASSSSRLRETESMDSASGGRIKTSLPSLIYILYKGITPTERAAKSFPPWLMPNAIFLTISRDLLLYLSPMVQIGSIEHLGRRRYWPVVSLATPSHGYFTISSSVTRIQSSRSFCIRWIGTSYFSDPKRMAVRSSPPKLRSSISINCFPP